MKIRIFQINLILHAITFIEVFLKALNQGCFIKGLLNMVNSLVMKVNKRKEGSDY